jgi:lipopolysaccharide/colanic/teichoic acid biosynthesis glycosyltransferase
MTDHAEPSGAFTPAWDRANVVLERHETAYAVAKRVLDVVLAGALLLALTPLLAVVALLIRLESPGSVFFVQERAGARRTRGRNEWRPRTFNVVKFRSMYSNADGAVHEAHIHSYANGELAGGDGGRTSFKIRNDPRVTPLGRLLRRTSIDELPQLLNVLRGDMSLVGPRPLPLYEAALLQGEQRLRLAALPGMTGLWQINGRCALPWGEMTRLDCEYVERRSLLLDLNILARTLPAVISGKGAS